MTFVLIHIGSVDFIFKLSSTRKALLRKFSATRKHTSPPILRPESAPEKDPEAWLKQEMWQLPGSRHRDRRTGATDG